MNKLVSSLTNEVAVAHQSGAMEADTISRNDAFDESVISSFLPPFVAVFLHSASFPPSIQETVP